MDKNKTPKVSVIIPVYNSAQFLDECFSSILNQTLNEIEIICVNDGSTDDSLDILNSYKEIDERIIIINQEQKGAGAARNAGMAIAHGEYLSFLDSDDIFENDLLESLYNTAIKTNADTCVANLDIFDNTTKQIGSFYPATLFKKYYVDKQAFCPKDSPNNEIIFETFRGWAWDKLFKREFVLRENLKFQEIRTTNDMLFVFMALVKSERVVTLDKILIHHRVNVKTSLENTREKSWDCFYIALKALLDELKKSNLYETYKKAFLNWSLNFSLWHLNTLFGTEAYCNIYRLLRDKAFEEFEITTAAENDFYNPDEYRQYKEIMGNTLEESLMGKIKNIQDENCRLVFQSEHDKQRLSEAVTNLENQIQHLKGEITSIKNSRTYRAGNFVLFVPKKIKGIVKGR